MSKKPRISLSMDEQIEKEVEIVEAAEVEIEADTEIEESEVENNNDTDSEPEPEVQPEKPKDVVQMVAVKATKFKMYHPYFKVYIGITEPVKVPFDSWTCCQLQAKLLLEM